VPFSPYYLAYYYNINMSTLTKEQLKTPLQLFYNWEKSQPNKPYLHQPINGEWHVWTWGEAADEIRRMAAYIEANHKKGSKIAIMSRNCAHWIMSDLAIMLAGCVSVPIYPNVNADTVKYVLDHSESEMCLVGKLMPNDWAEMRKGIPASVKCIKYGMYDLDADYPTWKEIIDAQEPKSESPTFTPDDIMTIIYTSGTTGRPKGVVHRFGAPVFAINRFNQYFAITPSDRFFSYLPLSHIAERMLIVMGSLMGGSTIHFAQSLDTFADNLKYCSPTLFLGVPRIWTKFQSGILAKFSPSTLNLLLAIPIVNNVIRGAIKKALGLTETRVNLSGAAPIPVSLLEWYNKLGILIHEVYGMTENSAYSHANVPGSVKFGTVGKDLPEIETKITEEGEICIKSYTNLIEYYKMPEKTAETIRDGWFHTGDKGVYDAEGFLRITGRVKDLFKTSKAKYVAPNPIELKLAKNEYIEQVCVVGIHIPQPIALVVLSEEGRKGDRDAISKSLQSTFQEVNQGLEHHEILQKMVVMQEEWTPENGMLTPTLKIKRSEVDDRFSANYEAWYDGGKGVIWQ